MKTIWQVRRAAFARALRAIAVSATRASRSKQPIRLPRVHQWRSIGAVALLACAFLLPAFAARAQVATTIGVTSSENPSHVGDTVTLTATVSSNGSGAPTGSVQFIDFATFTTTTVPLTLGSGDTSTAALTSSTFAAGNHGFDVSYVPTGNFSGSIVNFTQQVLAAGVTGTTTQLASSQNPSASGQSVTFTATVAADSGTTAPTGTVTFQVDGNTVSTPTLQTVGGVQQATFTTSSLTVSTSGHSVVAIYNLSMASNPNFGQSQANLNQVVTNGTPTTIAVTSTPNPSTANQSVTFTATVSPASGFTGSPSGTVDFKDTTTNTDLGTGTLQNVGGVQKASVSASLSAIGTHVIQVTYSGDTTFASDVVDFNQIVTSGTATTASIASSQNPSFLGNPVTFTVMIKPTSGTGTPTGNVTIQDAAPGGFSVVATLNGGQATFTTSNSNNLVAGTNNITVTYNGDATFAASTASLVQTVNTPVVTTTTVASSANPSLVGQSVTFTATVSPQSGTVTPTGSVIFTIDGTAGAPVKLSSGAATTSTSTLTVAGSPHSISAAYTSTDGSFGASTGQLTPGQTVNKNTSSTAVTSGQNPTATGNTVTFTATISGSGGGGVTPTGNVQFADNGTNVGAPVTLVNGVATLPILLSTGGTHTIKGTYNGDTNFNGSNGSFSETVNAGTATTTTVTSSPNNPSVFGQTVTFTATVSGSGGTPTGSVTFTIDGVAGSPINLVGGVASTSTSTLTVAGSPHTVTAAYSGDGTFTGSTSANFSQNVNAANTTTTVASSQNPSALNQSVTFTATVSAVSPGSGTPSGTVTFTIDGTAGAPINLVGGVASTSISTLTVAGSPHSVFATFTSNTTNFNGSTSNTIQQTIVNGSTTIMLVSSANPSTPGQSVTFTATITGTGGTGSPTGTVTFKDNGTTIGAPSVSTTGGVTTATATETITTTGAHAITAVYSGDANFGASNTSLTQNVNLGATKTTLMASPNPATPGQAVTFTATVTVTSGAGTLTGTVTFKDGTTTLGTGTLNGAGVATFTTTTPLTPGSHNITAVFSGNTSFATSTSTAVVETVNSPTTDSTKLREMQISTTPVIAQAWGQATAAAMDDAVSAGFGGNPQALSPAGTGFTYYFNDDAPPQRTGDADQDSLHRYLASPSANLASPDGKSASPDGKQALANDSAKRVDDDFRALGYAGGMPTKAPPSPAASPAPHEWLAWVTVRGTDYFRGTFGNDLKGDQVDVLAGLTRRISPNFVVGAFGGYERFDYNSQAFNAVLKGDGWTVGAYLGWKLAPNLRFDAGGAWSAITANDTAGTANGNFTGTRWLINGGLTGTYPWQMLVIEPSARVFALWEHENAFTDSLGTFQPARNFETGRASGGVKAIYPFAWTSSTVALSPYAGLYADYYFSKDDAQTAGLTTVPLLQGWSARVTGGVAASFSGGATLGAGGEFGGIGSATHIWTWTARGRIPF